jgi:hypothetical protein
MNPAEMGGKSLDIRRRLWYEYDVRKGFIYGDFR